MEARVAVGRHGQATDLQSLLPITLRPLYPFGDSSDPKAIENSSLNQSDAELASFLQ
jgi:hypothetical protein